LVARPIQSAGLFSHALIVGPTDAYPARPQTRSPRTSSACGRLHAKSVSGGVFGDLVLSSMVRVFIIRMGIHDHDDAEQADDGADLVPPVGAHRLLVG
jgi:hypothetical protein